MNPKKQVPEESRHGESRVEGPEERLARDGWKRCGELLGPLAAELGITPAAALAVLCVESGGTGFGPDGRLLIRFENHVFWDRWGSKSEANAARFHQHFRFNSQKRWLGHMYRMSGAGQAEGTSPESAWLVGHQKQAAEWEVLEIARAMNDAEALCSTSMGCAQLMGFHYLRAGYASVGKMFAKFSEAEVGEKHQVEAMFKFISGTRKRVNAGPRQTTGPMVEALRQEDYLRFAALYNGKGKAAEYAAKLVRFREAGRRILG